MFFIASKIMDYLLSPLGWIVILLVTGLVAWRVRGSKGFLIAGVIMLLFFTNPFIGDEFIRQWEIPVSKMPDTSVKREAGVLLAGDIATYDHREGRIIFRSGADRLMQTLYLYQKGTINKIIISGGSGLLGNKGDKESVIIKNYLVDIGIAGENIIVDSLSTNTHQNIDNVVQILEDRAISGEIILVTSSLHMRRANECFKVHGIKVAMFPTGKITGPRKYNFEHLVIPSIDTLKHWDWLIHEWVGYFSYKFMNYC
jgi:uncharacterized SAM-binding protein YcdF (DUF218 family)